MNGLVISKIEKEPKPILNQEMQIKKENLKQSMISHYEIPVDYEIKGNFLDI